ncbi:hypothetical protein AwMethylo_22110 [Methylobacterium sp.]|nr:hypothetical protein AwMethylo_22110 [Methylobacterium sp.]
MQVVDAGRIAGGERAGEAIRLLLVVALQADPVAGAQHRLQKGDRIGGRDVLAVREGSARRDAGVAGLALPAPSRHRRSSLPPETIRTAFVFRMTDLSTFCI